MHLNVHEPWTPSPEPFPPQSMANNYLGRTVRVRTNDGRALYGVLKAYTYNRDIIISDTLEQQPASKHIRQVGSVVVPGPEVAQVSLQHL